MGHEGAIAWLSKIGGAVFGTKWPEKSGSVVGILATLLGSAFQLYPPLAKSGIAAPAFVACMIAAALFFGMTGAFVLGRRQWASPARQARRLVSKLHEQWFPGEDGAIDTDYRLSLWVPSPSLDAPEHWRCLHRTGTPTQKTWKAIREPEMLAYAGVVAYSAHKQVDMTVVGLTHEHRSDLNRVNQYRRDAKVDESRHSQMSWKYAAIRSVCVRHDTGAIAGVLLVERECGQRIPDHLDGKAYWTQGPGDSYVPVDVLAQELALVASIWSAAMSPPDGGA